MRLDFMYDSPQLQEKNRSSLETITDRMPRMTKIKKLKATRK